MRVLSCFILILIIQGLGATDLQICIKNELKEMDLMKHPTSLNQEVLFKNVYETLFHYDPINRKVYANLAKKLSKVDKDTYQIEIKKNVLFHNNKNFFVKKTLTNKDVIFSLKRNPSKHIYQLENHKDKLQFKSDLSIQELYILLSMPQHIILSSAYFNYLKKKKRLSYFLERPLGTGPFTLKNFKIPYQLRSFEHYHLKNRLSQIIYKVSKQASVDTSCDVFWHETPYQLSELRKKHGYKTIESRPKTLFTFVLGNTKEKSHLLEVLDQNRLYKEVFQSYSGSFSPSVLPPDQIKLVSLSSKSKIQSKEKEITLYIDKSITDQREYQQLAIKVRNYFKGKSKILKVTNDIKQKYDYAFIKVNDLFTIKDLHKKLLCPFKSKYCESKLTGEELHTALLIEKKFAPISYQKSYLIYRKNIENLKVDFQYSIDYSEALIIK